jgi:hypothetical protein
MTDEIPQHVAEAFPLRHLRRANRSETSLVYQAGGRSCEVRLRSVFSAREHRHHIGGIMLQEVKSPGSVTLSNSEI